MCFCVLDFPMGKDLVTSYWRSADTRLYDEFKGKVKEIHKVGDCLAPRRGINAIYEAYKVAMKL